MASAAALVFAPVVSLGLLACDDGPEAKKAGEAKSVVEGGTPESAAGRKVEQAKHEIEGAEQQLQARDDEIFEKSAGEQAPRGVP